MTKRQKKLMMARMNPLRFLNPWEFFLALVFCMLLAAPLWGAPHHAQIIQSDAASMCTHHKS